MNRRVFLGAALAFPAIVRSASLMKCTGIIVPETRILIPTSNADPTKWYLTTSEGTAFHQYNELLRYKVTERFVTSAR